MDYTLILSTVISIIIIIIIVFYYTVKSNEDKIIEYVTDKIINEVITDENVNNAIDEYLTDENISKAMDKYLTDDVIKTNMLKYTGCDNMGCLALKGIEMSINANKDDDFCKREEAAGNKCFNKCVLWTDMDNLDRIRTYCNNDHGIAYDYSGNKSQGHCILGQGIASCKLNPTLADGEPKLFKNCAMWHLATDKATATQYCINDYGPGYIAGDATGTGCSFGFGKAFCVKA